MFKLEKRKNYPIFMAIEESHRFVIELLTKDIDNCDPAIRLAITDFVRRLTPSHSLRSRKWSLTSLVKQTLDDPFANFWAHYIKGKQPPKLSILMGKEHPDPELYVIRLARIIRKKGKHPIDSFEHKNFDPTIDALRYLTSSFQHYTSNNITSVKFEDDLYGDQKIAVLQRAKTKKGRRADDLPWYLVFNHAPFCELCCVPTEHVYEQERLLRNEYVAPQDLNLIQNNPIQTPSFSNRYCVDHNPSRDLQSYKKAFRMRKDFYSLIRLFIETRRCLDLRAYELEDVREIAHEILTHEILSKKIVPLKVRKQITKVLTDYYATQKNSTDRGNVIEELISIARRVFPSSCLMY